MKRSSEYDAIVVDLDGTLYFQKPVRIAMATEAILRPWRARDLAVVWKYRKLLEREVPEEERLHLLPPNAPAVVREWLVERPLRLVARFEDETLVDMLRETSESGTTVIVYSDHPVEEKLKALNFAPDFALRSEDVGLPKPNADGLKAFLSERGIDPKRCLVIGDRFEKDGKLAENMGADSLILPKGKGKRRKAYGKLRETIERGNSP